MKRSLHRLFTLFTAMSLVLCVAVAVLWVRSYWSGEQVRWRAGAGSWFVTSNHGAVLVLAAAGDAMPSRGERLAYVRWPAFPTVPTGGLTLRPLSLGFQAGTGTLSPAMAYRAVLVPWWAVTALAAAWSLLWGWAWVRRRVLDRRRRLGLCPSCGYDLRATPGCCPECGTIPAAHGKPAA